MASGNGPEKISVSRDALRADLAEMELRLREYIAHELEKKAEQRELERLTRRFEDLTRVMVRSDGPLADQVRRHNDSWNSFERGEFTPGQLRTIRESTRAMIQEERAEGWSARDRAFALVGTLVALAGLIITAIVTINTLTS